MCECVKKFRKPVLKWIPPTPPPKDFLAILARGAGRHPGMHTLTGPESIDAGQHELPGKCFLSTEPDGAAAETP